MPETNHIRCQLLHPGPYEGTFSSRPEHPPVPITHAATYAECGPLLDRIGMWAICTDGLLAMGYNYWIAADRLEESHWFEHVSEKRWVNESEFGEALERARAWYRAGYMVAAKKQPDREADQQSG